MNDLYQRKSFHYVKRDCKRQSLNARNESDGHDVRLVQTDAIKSVSLFYYSIVQLASGRS